MIDTVDTTDTAAATANDQLKHEVIQVLESILADARFAAAPQMSAFLNYVVRQTLAGEADRIKAYTVGVDALGKPDTFDPQNDPSVRVLAKRLRTFLDEYNVRTSAAPLYIELRPGSYRPLFLTRPLHGSPAANTESPDTLRVNAPLAVNILPTEAPIDAESPARHDGRLSTDAQAASNSVSGARPETGSVAPTSKVAAAMGVQGSSGIWSARSLILAAVAAGVLYSLAQVGSLGPASDYTLTASIDDNAGSAFDARAPAAALPLQRPTRPQIEVLGFRADQGALGTQIATLLSSTMLNAGELDVLRGSGDVKNAYGWPERYVLSLQTLGAGDEGVRLEVQLVNASDQRLAHVSSLQLSTTGAGHLDAASLESLESLALSLANESGPLFNDYNKHYAQSKQSPADGSLAEGSQ
jgi:hypothetical protein